MSRIGKKPIAIPAGVEVTIGEGNLVTVKGPKGTATQKLHENMIIKVEGNVATVERPNDEALNKSLHGLTRTLLSNMVIGVSEGYTKQPAWRKDEVIAGMDIEEVDSNNIKLNFGRTETTLHKVVVMG